MPIQKLLKEKEMSIYKLSKLSGVPYATCRDIVTEKAELKKCSAETVYKIAKALDITMETLLDTYFIKRPSFENFKSEICHRIKHMGDIGFMIDVIESDSIRKYFDRGWHPESLYLLAMLDYLSRVNDIPICEDYDDLRERTLEKTIYPAGVIVRARVSDNDVLKRAEKEAIPEFKRFNIIESEVRNVV